MTGADDPWTPGLSAFQPPGTPNRGPAEVVAGFFGAAKDAPDMVSDSPRDSLRRLLVGPGRTALRVGVPTVVAAGVVTAATTAWFLGSQSGGVYWPLDAAAVGVVASAAYATRYRAAVVCLAIGAAAFVGSDVGFHALNGNERVLGVLARAAGRPDILGAGAVFGAVGAAVGGVVGRVLDVRRQRG